MFPGIKRSGAVLLLLVALCASFVLGLSVGGPVHQAVGQAAVDAESQLFTTLYKQVNPSVVSITVLIPAPTSSDNNSPQIPNLPNGTPGPFVVPGLPNGTPAPSETGDASGFIYDTDGHIVTNSHVVRDANRIEVTFADDVTVTAQVVGMDLDSDLAVLKVDTDKSRLVPA